VGEVESGHDGSFHHLCHRQESDLCYVVYHVNHLYSLYHHAYYDLYYGYGVFLESESESGFCCHGAGGLFGQIL
jgi:hypothetical protein